MSAQSGVHDRVQGESAVAPGFMITASVRAGQSVSLVVRLLQQQLRIGQGSG